ncbi:MAG: fatty acid--CoA ligase [Pseudomonadota bacterium]
MTYYPQLQTVGDVIKHHAEQRSEHLALICDSRTLTYGELHRRSNRTAHGIKSSGLGPGARIAYLGKESEDYYDLLFGCAKSDTVLVPINWRLAAEEVSHILQDSETRLLFVSEELRSLAEQVRAGLPDLAQVLVMDRDGDAGAGFRAWQAGFNDENHHPVGDSDAAVAQLYTSGTTGLPKGVVLAHRSFFKIREALAEHQLDWIDWRDGDRSLIGIPGFHVGGLWWAMQGFSAGVTNVAMSIFVAYDAVRLIESKGITTACVVPAMIQMMLNDKRATGETFASLRKVVYGGSPISETLLEDGLRVMGCDFAQIYGLTETGNTSVCLPPKAHVPGSPRMKAAGRPYPGVELKILNEQGRALEAHGIGEVCIHTPARMLEYWNNPVATADTLIDGWIHTGDAGYLDDEGYLFICDRIKDVVIVAGENVYPAEVENALTKHPAVVEAAVIGIPDERWGEAVSAFVVCRDGQMVSPRELLMFLKSIIADFKIPTKYEFIDRVPRNPSGKILRRKLRDQYWRHMERKVN